MHNNKRLTSLIATVFALLQTAWVSACREQTSEEKHSQELEVNSSQENSSVAKKYTAKATQHSKGSHTRKPIPSSEELKKLPADGGAEYNRLVFEQSPYLLQHAGNPIDWFPWGEEAFAKAKKEDKPVFLSIGYTTCHWCHVMEHESFEAE